MPRWIVAWCFLLMALLASGLVQAESGESGVPPLASATLAFSQEAFAPPEQFTGTVMVSLRGGNEGDAGFDLTGDLEVWGGELYRFSYTAPARIAGRVVVVSDDIGYTYWGNVDSGEFIYYPEGTGYLMPIMRVMSLLQELSTLKLSERELGELNGKVVEVLHGSFYPGDGTALAGTIWADIHTGVPIRYEIETPNGLQVYEIQAQGSLSEIHEFVLSGSSSDSADTMTVVFTKWSEDRWFPTRIRLLSESAQVEQQLANLDFAPGLKPEDIQLPKLEKMRHHVHSGEAAREQGDFGTFAQHFEEVARIDPYNFAAHLDLGYAYLVLGDDLRAEAHLQQALMLEPELAVAYNNLAYLYIERDLYVQKGVGLAEKAVALDEDNPAYLDTLGWGYYRQGRYPEAVRMLKKAIAVGEADMQQDALLEMYYHLAAAYTAAGAHAAAEDVAEKALAVPGESEYHEKLRQFIREDH